MTEQEMRLAARQLKKFFNILNETNPHTGVRMFPKDDALRYAGAAFGTIIADIRREAAEKEG